MSLVNDMLQDLDRRAARGELRSRATGLQATSSRRNLRRLAWICAAHGTFAVCGIAAVSWIALERADRNLEIQRERSNPPELPSVDSAPPAPPAPQLPAALPLVIEEISPAPTPVVLPPSENRQETAPVPQPLAEPVSARRPSPVIAADLYPSDIELATQLVREGEQLLAAGRLDAGLDAWRRALKLDPARTSLYLRGATSLVAAGRPAGAQAWMEPRRAAKPLDPALRMLAARLELERSGPAEALQLLEAPLPALGDGSALHSLRAALLQREQRHDEALEAYRALVARHPDRGRLWFGLAISAEALGRAAEASVALHQALEDPELPVVLARHAGRRLATAVEQADAEPSQ